MSKNGRTPAAAAQDPEKLERVKSELEHLEEIFSEIDPNKRDFVQRHIEQLAWYSVSIADLQAKVDKWGTMIKYDNGGGQTGIKPNPDVKTLLDYQKCCNTIIRTLITLVPDKRESFKLDAFLSDLNEDEDTEDWADRRVKEINEQIKRAAEKDKLLRNS